MLPIFMNNAVSEVAKVRKRSEKRKVKSEKFGAVEKKSILLFLYLKKIVTLQPSINRFFKPKDYEKVKFESSSYSARR